MKFTLHRRPVAAAAHSGGGMDRVIERTGLSKRLKLALAAGALLIAAVALLSPGAERQQPDGGTRTA